MAELTPNQLLLQELQGNNPTQTTTPLSVQAPQNGVSPNDELLQELQKHTNETQNNPTQTTTPISNTANDPADCEYTVTYKANRNTTTASGSYSTKETEGNSESMRDFNEVRYSFR